MKLPVIRKLVEMYTLDRLQQAEANLLEGQAAGIDVEGEDEGEQLTHILGAIDILFRVQQEGKPLAVATREFFERVRNSIS
jgi:hypothetical protein